MNATPSKRIPGSAAAIFFSCVILARRTPGAVSLTTPERAWRKAQRSASH